MLRIRRTLLVLACGGAVACQSAGGEGTGGSAGVGPGESDATEDRPEPDAAGPDREPPAAAPGSSGWARLPDCRRGEPRTGACAEALSCSEILACQAAPGADGCSEDCLERGTTLGRVYYRQLEHCLDQRSSLAEH